MKIGILTHQYINNYGAFLQAWALRKAISELFPEDEVQIIDYVNVKHYIINAGGWFRFYKNSCPYRNQQFAKTGCAPAALHGATH